MNIERTIERLRAEFLEMPGLRLTAEQVTRLCGVDAAICHGVLNALIDVGFLRRNVDGTYARLNDDLSVRRHILRADVPAHPIREAS